MPPFLPGHTTNVGKTFEAAKIKRSLKRIEKKQALKEEEMVEKFKRTQTNPNSLANLLPAFKKGHSQLGHTKKRTNSIKNTLIWEITHGNDHYAKAIALKLLNLAQAGDLKAIEMVMDRLDGKVPTVVGGDKDNPLIIQVEPIIKKRYQK